MNVNIDVKHAIYRIHENTCMPSQRKAHLQTHQSQQVIYLHQGATLGPFFGCANKTLTLSPNLNSGCACADHFRSSLCLCLSLSLFLLFLLLAIPVPEGSFDVDSHSGAPSIARPIPIEGRYRPQDWDLPSSV